MNLRSKSLALSIFSDRMFRVATYLPLAAVAAFALLSFFSGIFHGFAFDEVSAKSFGFAKSASLPGHQWSGAGTQYRFYHIRSVHLGCVDRWPPSILDRLLFVASA